MNIIKTNHAIERWQERFIGIDFDEQFKLSKPATKSQRLSIKGLSGNSYDKNKYNYLVSPCGCAFVVRNNRVITVMPFIEKITIKKNHRGKKANMYR